MDEIARIKPILDRYHRKPYTPAADVLFVFDTEVFYYTGSVQGTDAVTDTLAVNQTIITAWGAGAALETIHLGDLTRIDLSRFRVVVFANTWLLSAAQRRFIRDHVMRDGRQVVFQGMPGYVDGETLSIEHARDATGIADLRVLGDSGKWAQRLGAGDQTKPVLRRGDTWFATTPLSTAEEWRSIFEAAGAHVYVRSGDIIHAGGGLVLLHTRKGGNVSLRLRSRKTFDLVLEPKTSALFDAESGERLL